MRLTPANRRPGMSLLEVLGATAIFLISIVAIGELMSLSTDQAVQVQFRSRATRLCQSKLNEFTSGVLPLEGSNSGEFDEEPTWKWTANVASESSALNLYRITVTVTRESLTGGEPVEVSMTQMVYDPLQRGQLPAPTASSDSSSSSAGSSSATGSKSSAGNSTGAASTGSSSTPASGGTKTGGGGTSGGGTMGGGGNTGGGGTKGGFGGGNGGKS